MDDVHMLQNRSPSGTAQDDSNSMSNNDTSTKELNHGQLNDVQSDNHANSIHGGSHHDDPAGPGGLSAEEQALAVLAKFTYS